MELVRNRSLGLVQAFFHSKNLENKSCKYSLWCSGFDTWWRLRLERLPIIPAQSNPWTICRRAGFCICGERFEGLRTFCTLLTASLKALLAPKTTTRELYDEGQAVIRCFVHGDDIPTEANVCDAWLHIGCDDDDMNGKLFLRTTKWLLRR